MKSIHSQRLERWMGADSVEHISKRMRGWYGPPIHLLDVPGSVRVCGDGDFVGSFDRGYFASARDSLRDIYRRAGRVRHGQLNVGFTGIADALTREKTGYSQVLYFQKSPAAAAAGATTSSWFAGNSPPAGSAGAAAPGGTVHVDSDSGSPNFSNPATGTTHLVGIEGLGSGTTNAARQSFMLYDRLFSVAKTMNSTSTEAVTGTPSRYQNTTGGAVDSIEGNFGFVDVGTVLPATAHNWTTCLYTDQGGASSTLPSVTGLASCAAQRLDHTVYNWFMPLAAGDTGIGAWTQMQCSALVASGACNFVIGHPIGFFTSTLVHSYWAYDWLTNRQLAPRIFDDACLSWLLFSDGNNTPSMSVAVTIVNAP